MLIQTACYIFEPQEVPMSGYINEINNCKSDSPDGGKFKRNHNVEIQVHKNGLQNAESQPSVNRNKLNNNKDAIRNNRNAAIREEGLSNCLEKSNVNINGVPSHSNLKSNHNTNQNKHVSSVQPPNCSAKRLSQPKECNNTNLEGDHPKLPLAATESCQDRQLPTTVENGCLAQSAMLEAQSVCSPEPDFSKNASQQTVVGHDSLSSSHTHSTQSTAPIILNKHGDPALYDSGDQACRTGTLNGCLEDKMFGDNPWLRPKSEAFLEAKEVGCGAVNGEFEEEDADVAEALAALEAATAGEDFDEVEEEY
uniref:Uncharacterized protein n=1 Tax=Sphaerodactylus townsendi TaxID=933632 RepID=A0ACB8E717_9SAUR